MKKRLISLLCALLMVCGLPGAAHAATPRASDYFSATDVRAYATGDSEILIEFDIDATHTMLEVGATEVYIFEEQDDGDFEIVHTFYHTAPGYYDDMMAQNDAFCEGQVTYTGIPGVRYYAKCRLYARDANGSDMLYFNTLIVTCRGTP